MRRASPTTRSVPSTTATFAFAAAQRSLTTLVRGIPDQAAAPACLDRDSPERSTPESRESPRPLPTPQRWPVRRVRPTARASPGSGVGESDSHVATREGCWGMPAPGVYDAERRPTYYPPGDEAFAIDEIGCAGSSRRARVEWYTPGVSDQPQDQLSVLKLDAVRTPAGSLDRCALYVYPRMKPGIRSVGPSARSAAFGQLYERINGRRIATIASAALGLFVFNVVSSSW